jgi:hypothetical protein
MLSNFIQNFIPTKDRGFYAHKTSSLKSVVEHSLAPTFNFQLFFRPQTTGKIFEYGTIFVVSIANSNILIEISLLDEINHVEVKRTGSIKCSLGFWNNLSINFIQNTGWTVSGSLMNSGSILDSVSISTQTSEKLELVKRNLEYLYMGDSLHLDTVSGFYYELKITNSLVFTSLNDYHLNICDFLSFWDGSSCQSCMGSCQISCVRATDCITCASSNCDSCQGYGFNDCLQCNNGQTPPVCCDFGCSSCNSITDCITCSPGFHLTSVYCVFELPTGYDGSVDVQKNVFQVNFASGNFDDLLSSFYLPNGLPVFVKGRGLYFDGNSYLVSKSKFVLAVSFSIEILFKCIRVGEFPMFYLADTLTLRTTTNILEIVIVDSVGNFIYEVVSGTVNPNVWSYLGVRVLGC